MNSKDYYWNWHTVDFADAGEVFTPDCPEDERTLECCLKAVCRGEDGYEESFWSVYKVNINNIIIAKFSVKDAKRILKLNEL
jgi:hypothetical protein